MQFKHPEILYALLFLIIPIIVHLFQLQRFTKVHFTNVKFLKNIEQQTRKSARLKKWLILAFRLLAFASLILAFSQPYFSKFSRQQNFHTSIYLDNSYSMQAKGENGELLKSVAQKIIEYNPSEINNISLLTNYNNYEALNAQSLKAELIDLKYHPNKVDLSTILLKSNSKNKANSINNIVLISDFQHINYTKSAINFTKANQVIQLVKVSPKTTNNVFIDSVYLNKKSSTEITLKAIIKSTQNSSENIPISLFKESELIGKTTLNFKGSKHSTIEFTIPNQANFNGKISLNDDNLTFDNNFYFSISKPEKINVLSIGKTSLFLPKIYTKNEFNFSSAPLQNLNYNIIQNQQLIILNEIDNFPIELIDNLNNFSKNGGSLVIIPSEKSNINSYNALFKLLNIGKINAKTEKKHKITSINYNHPIVNDIFEKKVTNFNYPQTAGHYKIALKNGSSILKLDNNDIYIASIKNENGAVYWIATPLNKEFSASIIVPLFYNFARNSLKISPLYYTIAPENKIEIKTSIGKDNVLKISNKTSTFIPLQNISQNKVTLVLKDNISKSGFYTITNNNTTIKTIAFNYNREESDLTYINIDDLADTHKNVSITSSIDEVFNELNNQQKINWLFKWFLAFSVLFLLIEMIILKYFKI
jgi:aerotolerance regulator-like protein